MMKLSSRATKQREEDLRPMTTGGALLAQPAFMDPGSRGTGMTPAPLGRDDE